MVMPQHAVLAVIRFRLDLFIVGCLASGQSPCLRSGRSKDDELFAISVAWEDLSMVFLNDQATRFRPIDRVLLICEGRRV